MRAFLSILTAAVLVTANVRAQAPARPLRGAAAAAQAPIDADPVPPSLPAARLHDPDRPILAVPVEPKGYTFYGWQSMLVEGVGAALIAGGGFAGVAGAKGEGVGTTIGVGSFTVAIGGLAVQAVRGKWAKVAGSASIIFGLPLTGLAIAMGASRRACESCRERSAATGAIVGVLAVPIIDGLAFGWERRHNTYRGVSPPRSFASIAPIAVSVEGGFVGGVVVVGRW